jgi:hypothetical protein
MRLNARGRFLALAGRIIELALPAAAIFYLLQLLLLALSRLLYPYELEWMEGAVVDHVRRVLAGQPLYVEPSLEFTSFIYPPFYYYLSALVSLLTGVGFFPLRLVSFAASTGCLILIYRYAGRETGSPRLGLVSAGLYAACFELGGGWLDVARIDCLFVFLLLLAAYLLRFHKGAGAAAAAGGVFALAALTKQPALLVAAVSALFCFLFRGVRPGAAFAAAFTVIFGGATAALRLSSDGWYGYYIFELPAQHPLFPVMLTRFWTHDLGHALPVVAVTLTGHLFSGLRALRTLSSEERDALLFRLFFLAAMLGAAWSSRIHFGGASNVLLPAVAGLALCWGAALQRPLPRFWRRPWTGNGSRKQSHGEIPPWDTRIRLGVNALALLQLGWLFYNPADYLPTAADRRAGEQFVRALARFPGEVYTPEHGYLPALAGKKTYSHYAVLWDILRADDNPIRRGLEQRISAAFRAKRFAAVVLQAPALTHPLLIKHIRMNYRYHGPLLPGETRFWHINGNDPALERNPDLFLPLKQAPAAPRSGAGQGR